jgi:hypothetical protein
MRAVRAVDTRRDYSILIDKSGSMAGGRWRDVRRIPCNLAIGGREDCGASESEFTLYLRAV